MSMKKEDRREKIRKLNEANLYRYKATLDTYLEYIHLGVDLYSASVDEDVFLEKKNYLEGFQKYICSKIDECDKVSPGRKNKGHIF